MTVAEQLLENGHSDGTPFAFLNGHSDGTSFAFLNGHSDGTL